MRILFLENLPYESDVRVGSHHYAMRFARDGHEVLWISHPISPLHFLRRTKRDLGQRVAAWRSGPLVAGGVRWYSPMVALPPADAPLLRARFVYDGVAWLSVPPLRGVLERTGFLAPDVIWLTNPYYAAFAGTLGAAVHVVRVADDSASFEGVSPVVRHAENRAVRIADVVFAVSQPLVERLSSLNEHVVHLPNGVEFEHFSQKVAEPEEYRGTPRPRAVYAGAQEYWFDVELVVECAARLPQATFFLIGPTSRRVTDAVDALQNVKVLGPRPYAMLPSYLQHADVGIIPFRRDPMIDAVHPIKVYEYLAAGLPVVATRWTELERMRAPIRLADRDTFCRALFEELEEPSHPYDERIVYAAASAWEVRFELARDTIEALRRGPNGV